MIDIPKSAKSDHPSMRGTPDPLTWNPIEYKRARRQVWCEFTCPNGHGASIGRQHHTIADDGSVSPSLICPRANDGCTFHEYVRLLDWNPEDGREE